MAKNVRVSAVPRESIDIDKLVSGLMLLLEELSQTSTDDHTPTAAPEDPGNDGGDRS